MPTIGVGESETLGFELRWSNLIARSGIPWIMGPSLLRLPEAWVLGTVYVSIERVDTDLGYGEKYGRCGYLYANKKRSFDLWRKVESRIFKKATSVPFGSYDLVAPQGLQPYVSYIQFTLRTRLQS